MWAPVFVLVGLLACYAYTRAASDPYHVPFGIEELNKFIQDVPTFTAFISQKTSYTMNKLVGSDQKEILASPAVAGFLETAGWVPERFSYIFGHVITAAFMRDMSGTGEKRLAYMVTKREQLKERMDIPEARRKELLTHLDADIEALKSTVSAAKSIPESELILMWQKREEIDKSFQEFHSRATITRTERPNF